MQSKSLRVITFDFDDLRIFRLTLNFLAKTDFCKLDFATKVKVIDNMAKISYTQSFFNYKSTIIPVRNIENIASIAKGSLK